MGVCGWGDFKRSELRRHLEHTEHTPFLACHGLIWGWREWGGDCLGSQEPADPRSLLHSIPKV